MNLAYFMNVKNNIEFDSVPPNPEATIESSRSLGYDLNIAIADIIDNSISAEAKNIWIHYEWLNNETYFSIIDDGNGMLKNELIEAMRLGTISPKNKRDKKDLGRFGLGLKTASFSQCRVLTVKSKKDSLDSLRKWDLNHVSKVNDWQLLRTADNFSQKILDKKLQSLQSGTVVLWQDLDRLITLEDEEEKNKDYFYEKIADLRKYLSMIYHRYLSGSNAIKIFLTPDLNDCDNYKIIGWDPFCISNSHTEEIGSETLIYKKNKISVTPYVLPHHSKFLSKKDHENAGGPNGWNQHQGFFIYRNKRLLLPGGWLGFYKQEDHYKLARIRVDIPNSMDEEWKIGIKKATVFPPDTFKKELKRIAQITREKATKAYRYRGKLDKRGNPEIKKYVWNRTVKTRTGEVKYSINMKHPLINDALNNAKDKKELHDLLNLIAKTVPVETIVQSDRENPDAHTLGSNKSEIDGIEIIDKFEKLLKSLINDGFSEDQAFQTVMSIEPFNIYSKEIYLHKGFKNNE